VGRAGQSAPRSKRLNRLGRYSGGIRAANFSVAQVARALRAARGSFAGASRALRCSRSTVKNYTLRHPELYAACVEAREALLDDAETALTDLIGRRDLGAICFFLKTQGKARGYVERVDLSVGPAYDFRRLSDRELLALAPLLAKLRGDVPLDEPGGGVPPPALPAHVGAA